MNGRYEQALCELRDYFREMSALRKREANQPEASAYAHAMEMTIAYLGDDPPERKAEPRGCPTPGACSCM